MTLTNIQAIVKFKANAMHETGVVKGILRYLENEEKNSSKRVRRLCINLSEFGGFTEEHFREHYRRASAGTRWGSVELEIAKVPQGPELEITRIDFE